MKKIPKQLGFCIGIALLCTIAACQKETGSPIDGGLIKYFDYKVGTYWIMRDSISGRVDSFFVTSNQFAASSGGNNINSIKIDVFEYTNDEINVDKIDWDFGMYSNLLSLDIICPKQNFHYTPQDILSYPFVSNPPYQYNFPTYTLNGTVYSNVTECVQDIEGPNVSPAWAYDDLFYINTDAGFIKIKLSHPAANVNYVWELQREHIVH